MADDLYIPQAQLSRLERLVAPGKVEEWGGRLYAAEMKWSPRSAARTPGGWRQAYPDSAFRTVHRENYLDFITASAS